MSKIDWNEINRKLPYEQTDEAKAKRRKLFSDFDPNGNGYLSLAEVSLENTDPQNQVTFSLLLGGPRSSRCAEM